MKVKELTGAMLDYWAAKAMGYRFWAETRGASDPYTLCVSQRPGEREPWMRTRYSDEAKKRYSEVHTFNGLKIGFFGEGVPKFSTNWEQGGPIIERERINLQARDGGTWQAHYNGGWSHLSDTLLVAAMRAYVASRYGDEVPDEAAT